MGVIHHRRGNGEAYSRLGTATLYVESNAWKSDLDGPKWKQGPPTRSPREDTPPDPYPALKAVYTLRDSGARGVLLAPEKNDPGTACLRRSGVDLGPGKVRSIRT